MQFLKNKEIISEQVLASASKVKAQREQKKKKKKKLIETIKDK